MPNQFHLYASQRQQNTPHEIFSVFFLAGATALPLAILLLPFSVFYVYIRGSDFIFLFPDTCVLRIYFVCTFIYYTICFHGDFIHICSLFSSVSHLQYEFLHFIHYTIQLFYLSLKQFGWNLCGRPKNKSNFRFLNEIQHNISQIRTQIRKQFSSRWCLQRNLFSIDSTGRV